MSEQQRLDLPIAISELESHLWEAANILRGSPVNVGTALQGAFRRTLFKYKLHQDTDLFDRAYEYIRQYY